MTATQDAIRKAQAEYRREWRKKNPDKVKAAQDRYWTKKAQELQAKKEAQNGTNANASQ